MQTVFLYGTLRDTVLRQRIVGGDLPVQEATLQDHRVVRQVEANLPFLAKAEGFACAGLLLTDVTDQHMIRLDRYEAPFGYRARIVTVNTQTGDVAALAYYPDPAIAATDDDWSLQSWADTLAPVSREAAVEIGRYDPPLSEEALRQQWGMIETRAAARVRAAESDIPATVRHDGGTFEVTESGPLWGAFFKAGQIKLRHSVFGGGMSPELTRECFYGTDAAIVLPYDPETDLVLLIEQIRMGPLARGDRNPWSLEAVAGMVDGRETPEDAARRETLEEAGLDDTTLEKMFSFYASPGNTTDYFNCYLALASLPEPNTYTGGLETEHEDLRIHIIPFKQAFDLIASGEANVGPTVAMLLWLDRNRQRLRATA
ncbi:NUDIX domain-containing protein [Yoonia sp. 208BN28-4]|uniref:NUDIX domain-containing protein n=1 Tax=Yoonia sp. 208BN28-4 TaxID=3126505 RepID=UPI0030999866